MVGGSAMTIHDMTLMAKIRRLCGDRGWDQARLAREIGTRQTTVGNWWSGRSRPDLDNGLTLARLLGVPLDFLADDSAEFPAVVPVLGTAIGPDERALLDLLRQMEVPASAVREALVRGGTAILSPRQATPPAKQPITVEPGPGTVATGPDATPASKPATRPGRRDRTG